MRVTRVAVLLSAAPHKPHTRTPPLLPTGREQSVCHHLPTNRTHVPRLSSLRAGSSQFVIISPQTAHTYPASPPYGQGAVSLSSSPHKPHTRTLPLLPTGREQSVCHHLPTNRTHVPRLSSLRAGSSQFVIISPQTAHTYPASPPYGQGAVSLSSSPHKPQTRTPPLLPTGREQSVCHHLGQQGSY